MEIYSFSVRSLFCYLVRNGTMKRNFLQLKIIIVQNIIDIVAAHAFLSKYLEAGQQNGRKIYESNKSNEDVACLACSITTHHHVHLLNVFFPFAFFKAGVYVVRTVPQ